MNPWVLELIATPLSVADFKQLALDARGFAGCVADGAGPWVQGLRDALLKALYNVKTKLVQT